MSCFKTNEERKTESESIEQIYSNYSYTSYLDENSIERHNCMESFNLPNTLSLYENINSRSKKSLILISSLQRQINSESLFSFRIRLSNTINSNLIRDYKHICNLNVLSVIFPKYKMFFEYNNIRLFDKNVLKVSIDNCTENTYIDGTNYNLFNILIKDSETENTVTYKNIYPMTRNTMFSPSFEITFFNPIMKESFDYTNINSINEAKSIFNNIFCSYFLNNHNLEDKKKYVLYSKLLTKQFDIRLKHIDIYIIRSIKFNPMLSTFTIELDFTYPLNYILIGQSITIHNCQCNQNTDEPFIVEMNKLLQSNIHYVVTNIESSSYLKVIELGFPKIISSNVNSLYQYYELNNGKSNINIKDIIIYEQLDTYNESIKDFSVLIQNYAYLFNISWQFEFLLEITQDEEFFLQYKSKFAIAR